MKKLKLSLFLLLLVLGFSVSQEVLASSAKSVVETQIEGEGKVYQYVETTVNGETVKKESTQPGKLELEMKKNGEGEPVVTFSQEATSSPQPSEVSKPEEAVPDSFVVQIIEFFRKLLSHLTGWFK